MSRNAANSQLNASPVSSDLQAQRDYVRRMRDVGFDFSLMIANAFVRGIRDIGYKSTATALDELIDNAIQAEAENIHVFFGFAGSSNQPNKIAIVDDGHGMDPEMIRLSIIWGGTHRENDRSGFGRYGYGLPSASISQGRRFEVYSTTEGDEFFFGRLDLDEIKDGDYTNSEGRIIVPAVVGSELPGWVERKIKDSFGPDGLSHGTVVILDKLDRLTWKTARALERNLLEHFGIVYRNYLRAFALFVNGVRVEPLDPLFTTPGYRFYDYDEDRAEALDSISFEVKDSDSKKSLGTVKVRFSYMPPRFASEDKSKEAIRGNQNPRFRVMKEHNGLIVMRNGRQIDVVNIPWRTLLTYDRNWGVEVDFPATLDEEFSITTSKQQVVPSDRIWTLLRQANVDKAIEQLSGKIRRERKEEKEKREAEDKKRASERALEDAERYKRRRPGAETPERVAKREKRFQEEVRKKSEQTGVPESQVAKALRAEIQGHPYKVELENSPGAPFFRVEQIGGQMILYLNTAHRFYLDVYSGSDSTPYMRAALEVLLFVIGDCKLDANRDARLFYDVEVAEWSTRLDPALDRLDQFMVADEEEPQESADADELAEEMEVSNT